MLLRWRQTDHNHTIPLDLTHLLGDPGIINPRFRRWAHDRQQPLKDYRFLGNVTRYLGPYLPSQHVI